MLLTVIMLYLGMEVYLQMYRNAMTASGWMWLAVTVYLCQQFYDLFQEF